MKSGTKHMTKPLATVAIACLMAACLSLAACGGSGSSSAASSAASGSAASASASASSASASSSAASSAAASSASSASSADSTFVGTWLVAAVESQGLLMGGNFGSMFGEADNISLVINADGTGSMAMGDDSGQITWTAEGADSIWVTPQGDEASIQEAIQVTMKDDALFMPIEQDGQQVNVILTKDGNYDKAKQITLDDAQPITSEADLIGKWTLVGMNMGGVSMYGDAAAMAAAMGGEESWINFKEGGVLEMSTGEGSWAVSADGATITTTDITGTNTVPVVKLGDEIAVDYSAVYEGLPFIMVLAKA